VLPIVSEIPEGRDWRRAYITAISAQDSKDFYENMADAMELMNTREHDVLEAVSELGTDGVHYLLLMQELESLNDALSMLKACYKDRIGRGFLADIRDAS
jgi:hypothetical protein